MRLFFAGFFCFLLAASPVAAQPAGSGNFGSLPVSVVVRTGRTVTQEPDPAPPLTDRWIAYDKAQHFLASALLVLAGQYVLEAKGGAGHLSALPLAVGTSASAGLAKESWDARRPGGSGFSKKDLVADAAGIAAAVVVILW